MEQAINKDLLEILACPICRADITQLAETGALGCTVCGRIFPVHDGVPDMIPDDSPALSVCLPGSPAEKVKRH